LGNFMAFVEEAWGVVIFLVYFEERCG
jgi:hypothetical protein